MSREEVRTKTRDSVLVDQVLHSPVDDGVRQTRRKVFWGLIIAIVLLLVVYLAWRFNADRPVRYAGDLDHFQYGSIGSEPGGSLTNAIGGGAAPDHLFTGAP